MLINRRSDIPHYQFPKLSKFSEIRHGILTRNSGHSNKPFSSLNLSFNVGDNKNHVMQNRQIVSQLLETKDMIFANQIHGTQTLIFDKKNNPTLKQIDRLPLEGDSMITNINGLFLFIQVADCQSVILYDPEKKVVANIHSGWRGSINNIIGSTIERMQDTFDCRPSDIIAGVSPSLGPCCSEFINHETEIPAKFRQYKNDSNYFNFWEISRDQLHKTGVLKNNIQISQICTKCNPDLFFSYRGEAITGRFAGFIGLCNL